MHRRDLPADATANDEEALAVRYCPDCGSGVGLTVPAGDNRRRYVCDGCGTIHYQNPRMVVGAVCVWDGKLLMCRRAIEPRVGFWTIPPAILR